MSYNNDDHVRKFVLDAVSSHNEEVIIQAFCELEKEYKELATLSSDGAYEKSWTHEDLLDYLTHQ